jgi:hypothetical protein
MSGPGVDGAAGRRAMAQTTLHFLRASIEQVGYTMRRRQKQTDRALSDAISRLHVPLSQPASMSAEEAATAVDATVAELNDLKRHVVKALDEDEGHMRSTRRRLEAHQGPATLADPISSGVPGDAAAVGSATGPLGGSVLLNELLVDYLLQRGYTGTATSLAADSGVESSVVSLAHTESRALATHVRAHELTAVLEWCVTHRTKLKKLHPRLECLVHVRRFAEKILASDPAGAVAYARAHFPQMSEECRPLVQEAMGALACPPGRVHPLMADARWDELADEIFAAVGKLCCAPRAPLLLQALWAALTVLRTPSCKCAQAQHGGVEVALQAAASFASPADASSDDSGIEERANANAARAFASIARALSSSSEMQAMPRGANTAAAADLLGAVQ